MRICLHVGMWSLVNALTSGYRGSRSSLVIAKCLRPRAHRLHTASPFSNPIPHGTTPEQLLCE